MAAAGCGGEEAALSVRLLFPALSDGEPPSRAWAGKGCTAEVTPGECIAIRLSNCPCADPDLPCPPDPAACTSVFSDPTQAEEGLLTKLQGGTFDLPTNTAGLDLFLQIGMYRAGSLLATGEARRVAFDDESTVGLTLFPVGDGSACALPEGRSIQDLRKRTFHTATLLPNGEVLIVGGVTGPLLQAAPAGNALGGSMEVLDPRTGGIASLDAAEISNEAAGEVGGNLYRAFHEAAYLGTDDQGRYIVRVIGGVRVGANQSTVIVSLSRDATPLHLLYSGASEAEPAPPVDIHYDPVAKVATITDVATESADYPRASFGGFAALTDTLGSENVPGGVSAGWFIAGGLGAWTEAQRDANNVPKVQNGFLMSRDGDTINALPEPLLVGRVGASAIGIGDDEVLFWGGNMWSSEGTLTPEEADEALAAEIAEIHRPGGDDAPQMVTVTGVELPPATAFQAAAVAAVDGDVYRIVVAGGHVIGRLEALQIGSFAPTPVYLVSYDKASRTAEVTEVEGAEELGEVAHLTATLIAPGRVLVVGGNFQYTTPGNNQINSAARAAAGVITVTGENAVFERKDLGGARYGHTATRMLDGSVLILGGVVLECEPGEEQANECSGFGDITPLNTYEIYNEGLDFAGSRDCEEAAE